MRRGIRELKIPTNGRCIAAELAAAVGLMLCIGSSITRAQSLSNDGVQVVREMDSNGTNASSTTADHESWQDAPFTVYLQAAGHWSGLYTGDHLGIDDDTVILYQQEATGLAEGGPEFIDMNLHLGALEQAVTHRIAPDFDGLIVLQIDSFAPSIRYPSAKTWRNDRIERMRRGRASLSDDELLRLADERWQTSMQRVLLESISRLRALRPRARIGLYDLVSMPIIGEITDIHRQANDSASWLWDEVDVICPVISIGCHSREAIYEPVRGDLQSKVAEAVRLAESTERRTGSRPAVLPYLTHRVVNWGAAHASPFVSEWIAPEQTRDAFAATVRAGADGIILWQWVSDTDPNRQSEAEFIAEILEAQVRDVMEQFGLGVFAQDGVHIPDPLTSEEWGELVRIVEMRRKTASRGFDQNDLNMVRVQRESVSLTSPHRRAVTRSSYDDELRRIAISRSSRKLRGNARRQNTHSYRRVNNARNNRGSKSSSTGVTVHRKNPVIKDGVQVKEKQDSPVKEPVKEKDE